MSAFPEYYEFPNFWKVAEFFILLSANAPSASYMGCGNIARMDGYKESEAWKVEACARNCGGIKMPQPEGPGRER